MANHQRLESNTGSTKQGAHARSQSGTSNSQTQHKPHHHDKSWWKRFFCASSRPDPDQENVRPVDLSSAEMDEIDAKRQKRASYVPRHAGTDFSKTTTPLSPTEVDKAKRATLMYQRTQSDAEVKKAQKRATLIYQQGSIKIPGRGASDDGSESSSIKSPSTKSPPLSPPIGLSFEQPATGHF